MNLVVSQQSTVNSQYTMHIDHRILWITFIYWCLNSMHVSTEDLLAMNMINMSQHQIVRLLLTTHPTQICYNLTLKHEHSHSPKQVNTYRRIKRLELPNKQESQEKWQTSYGLKVSIVKRLSCHTGQCNIPLHDVIIIITK